jgi:hypothetical protein
MHHLKNVCTVGNTLDAQGLGRILEMFESTSQSAFKFTQDAQDLAKWVSPAGVIYQTGSKEGHRFIHALKHFSPTAGAAGRPHGIFNFARQDIYSFVDDIVANWNTLEKIQISNGVWHIKLDRVIGNADNIAGTNLLDTVNGPQLTEWVRYVHGGADPKNFTTVYPVNP